MTIGEKNKLHLDQLASLEAETSAVMLGFTESKDYPHMLVDALHVDQSKADAVSKDVNDMLFVKIRDAMKKVYEQNAVAPHIVSAPSSPSPAKKSVVMPSSIASKPAAPPIVPGAPKAVVPAPTPPTPAPDMHAANIMLTDKTINVPPTAKPAPPKPEAYKADPYREPAE